MISSLMKIIFARRKLKKNVHDESLSIIDIGISREEAIFQEEEQLVTPLPCDPSYSTTP